MKKIQAHIITGFLGAGKTTAIIELFRQKPKNEQWVAVINEFGKVAIDSMIVKDNIDIDNGVREIAGGCICCSSSDLFKTHIGEIIEQQYPDRIIIEPTGLGGIQMVKDILNDFSEIEVMPVICLVDVNSYCNTQVQNNGIYLSQIHNSNIIVISKCDTDISNQADRLINWMQEKYPDKLRYLKIEKGLLDVSILEAEKQNRSSNVPELGSTIIGLVTDITNYTEKSYIYPPELEFDIEKLQNMFTHDNSVIRSKGYVNTANGWVLFQTVMGKFTCIPAIPKRNSEIVTIWRNAESVVNFDTGILKSA